MLSFFGFGLATWVGMEYGPIAGILLAMFLVLYGFAQYIQGRDQEEASRRYDQEHGICHYCRYNPMNEYLDHPGCYHCTGHVETPVRKVPRAAKVSIKATQPKVEESQPLVDAPAPLVVRHKHGPQANSGPSWNQMPVSERQELVRSFGVLLVQPPVQFVR